MRSASAAPRRSRKHADPDLNLQATQSAGESRRQPVNGRGRSPLSRTCFPIFKLARQLFRRREPNCLQPQRRGRVRVLGAVVDKRYGLAEMRRFIWVTTLFSILATLAYASSAQASVSPGNHAIPQLHEGQICVKVHLQNNWQGQICAIVNEDDVTADHAAQALITFDINSGTLT